MAHTRSSVSKDLPIAGQLSKSNCRNDPSTAPRLQPHQYAKRRTLQTDAERIGARRSIECHGLPDWQLRGCAAAYLGECEAQVELIGGEGEDSG
jgi:hypothetical protein